MQTQQVQHESTDTPLSASKNGLYLQTFTFRDINNIWPLISGLYNSIGRNTRGRYAPNDILQLIQNEKQDIWLARKMADDQVVMACTTQVLQYPQLKSVFISVVAGENRFDWMWILPQIEQWAKSIGCTLVEADGRLGWAKTIEPAGYKKEKILFSKEL